ncbi:MAG: DUF255 domain-containing protein [Phycisphaerales bacterium]
MTINEKSPYLLQHAHDPVDWFPWGEEAFQTAKSKDVPVFLSIGYLACRCCIRTNTLLSRGAYDVLC